MFNKPTPDPGLAAVIIECESDLKSFPTESDEYKAALARYKDLQALKLATQPKRVSPDAVLNAVVSLIGIVAILKFESVNVITSKALGFVKKLT